MPILAASHSQIAAGVKSQKSKFQNGSEKRFDSAPPRAVPAKFELGRAPHPARSRATFWRTI
jgi:hypothetical protein